MKIVDALDFSSTNFHIICGVSFLSHPFSSYVFLSLTFVLVWDPGHRNRIVTEKPGPQVKLLLLLLNFQQVKLFEQVKLLFKPQLLLLKEEE